VIERIPYPEALPTATSDYVKQNNLIETGFLRVNDPWPIVGGNIVRGSVFQLGGTVYLATSDTAIGGVASDYVKLTPSGDGSTCSADYVASLAGVSWNDAYNGYYDVGGNLYVFDEFQAFHAEETSALNMKLFKAIYAAFGLNVFHLATNAVVTITENIWFQHVLTSQSNSIAGASVAAGVVTLPKGNYFAFAWIPSFRSTAVGATLIWSRIRNTSDASNVSASNKMTLGTSQNFIHTEILFGNFSIAAAKNYELQTWVDTFAGAAYTGNINSGEENARTVNLVIVKVG